MYKFLATAFAAAAFTALLTSPAAAAFNFTFDENGFGCFGGSLSGGDCDPAFIGSVLPDPADPSHSGLTFILPGLVVNGDVGIDEFGSLGVLSDLLRFTDAAGNLTGTTADRMIYFSDVGDLDLADTGFPSNMSTALDLIQVHENQAGTFDWFPGGNTYHGFSGGDVPEPAIWAMMLIGFFGVGTMMRRSRNVSAFATA